MVPVLSLRLANQECETGWNLIIKLNMRFLVSGTSRIDRSWKLLQLLEPLKVLGFFCQIPTLRAKISLNIWLCSVFTMIVKRQCDVEQKTSTGLWISRLLSGSERLHHCAIRRFFFYFPKLDTKFTLIHVTKHFPLDFPSSRAHTSK